MLVKKIDFRSDVEKEFDSKKEKKLSDATKAATSCARRQQETHPLHQFFDLLKIQSSLRDVGFLQIGTLDCTLMFGDRILLHVERQATARLPPNLES